mmetsp:Transcript_4607/g.8985  ORF Transcript_4607/g.8985 Transcript_4607/m.8985 type:complete len:649 (-) Transcript_4607:439-2385(-)
MDANEDLVEYDEVDPSLVGAGAGELDELEEFGGPYDNNTLVSAHNWQVGQEVEVYSRSKDRWIAATIRKIMTENGQDWIQVYYKNSSQMKDVRADSDDIRRLKAPPPPPLPGSKSHLSGPSTQIAITRQTSDGKSAQTLDFTQILHKVGAISRQVEGGLYLIKRVASVVHRIAAAEQQHVMACKKVLDQEKQKLKDKMMDEMTRCVDAWDSTERYLRGNMDKQEELAKNMEQKISNPMMQFYTDAELKRKAILKDEKKYGVEMNRAKVGVQKNLRNCQKLIKSCLLAKAEQEEKKKGGSIGKKKKFGAGMLKWAKNMMRGSLSELQNQAATAAKNYAASIEFANERQHQYYDKELPLICKQFEMLERSRINALHKYLHMLNEISRAHAEPVMKFIEDHKRLLSEMSPDKDITDFTAHTIRMYGPVPPMEPYTYQLPCTQKDIKAGRFQGNPNSFFYATLEHCMDMQKGKYDLDVPIIVVNLIKAIQDLGGMTVEGIFRLSAKKEDLVRLRAQFDKGDVEVRETSPHVPAGLLKQWLRELAEPLIPTELYEEAIKIAKSIKDEDPKLTKSVIDGFVTQLPALNQKVLEHICTLAGKIADLSSVNKMTYSNLAIVFAPGFLRNPSEDPAEMLENSKYETAFTNHLLQAVA